MPKSKRYIETGYKRSMIKDEVELILNSFEKHEIAYRVMCLMMAYIGLRSGEVCRLRRSDILGDCERLRYLLEKSQKIHERIIPDRVRRELKLYLFVSQYIKMSNDEFLFPPRKRSNSQHPHITPQTLRWRLLRMRHDLNLTDVYYTCTDGKKLQRISLHTFRHFFITQFYNLSGNDLALTRRIIGHKKLETTLIYITERIEEEGPIVNQI